MDVVCKAALHSETKMTAVETASNWTEAMVRRECRGHGDTDNALQRLARRHGISYRTLWGLKYRKPKDIWATVYLKIQAAYECELQRQKGLLANEIAIAQAKGWASPSLVAQVADVLGGDT